MSSAIDDSRAKIERAKVHYASLARDAAVWMVGEWEAIADTRPMTVRKERDPKQGTIHFIAEGLPQTDRS
jgi:uncharacterized protein (DUF1697 family)